MRSMIHTIGLTRFNLVVLLIILISLIISSNEAWATPQEINNSSPQNTDTVLKPTKVDISSELTADRDQVSPGQLIRYTFTFKNIGEDQPKNLYITFYAPNEFFPDIFHENFTRYVGIDSISSGIIFVDTTLTEDGRGLLKTITWRMDSLATTDEQKIKFTVRVDPSIKKSTTLTGIMTIVCDPDFVNQNSVDVILILLPELNVQKSVFHGGPYTPGDEGFYTINYSNKGERAIESVVIKDLFPSDLIFGEISPPPDTIINDNLFWYIGTLDKDSSGTITIPFQVDPNYQVPYPKGEFINRVDIKSGQYKDYSIVSFNVIAADIDAKIDPLPDYYSPGYPIELNATIKNIGISPVEDTFRVAFYWNDINSGIQIEDTIITYLKENAQDPAIVTATWKNPPPPEGDHMIIVYADCDSVIPEVSELNNLDTTIVRVQISELHVYNNEVLYYDNMIRDKSPKFPDDIFSYTSVLDQNLHPVHKLGSSSRWVSENEMTELDTALTNIWSLSENGKQVDSLSVTEILPDAGFAISTTIIIPISQSNILAAIKNELCNFINNFSATKDQFAVVSFSDHLLNVLPFSNNFENVCNAVTQESNEQPRVLFDAIYRGIAETAKQPGRRAVVAITDGNNFSYIQNNEVIEYAKRLSVPVFVLNYGTVNQQILQSLTDRCGGLYFDIPSADTLTDVFQKLYDIFNNYYIVSYSTPTKDMDGVWRPLDITIKYPNYLQPVGRNNQGIYLAPANNARIWMDIASFPSGLTENARGYLWKLTDFEERYEYVITFSNNGNRLLENVLLENWQSPYVDIATNVSPNYTADMGQNHVIDFMADVKDELPLQWLSIIDSAKITLDQQLMATAYDTVWLIQDLKPEIRVAFANEPYPQTDEPLRITLADLIMFWVSWPIYLEDFSIKIIPFEQNEIDFTGDIINMPQFPVEPDTLAIKPDYKPPKKFTELEEEPWVVRFEYIDQLGQSDFVETMFYIIAPNKLILDKNVSRRGEDVGITVFIAKENQVKIDVFNVTGEHIKNLEDTFYPKDSEATTTGKSLTWDCKDKDGRIVGSDVYVIVMEAGGFKTWQKVIVVH